MAPKASFVILRYNTNLSYQHENGAAVIEFVSLIDAQTIFRQLRNMSLRVLTEGTKTKCWVQVDPPLKGAQSYVFNFFPNFCKKVHIFLITHVKFQG